MPIYEYACQRCGRRFEKLVRSDTVVACPECGGDDLKKLLSAFAVGGGGGAAMAPVAAGPCGSCGHPDGPGSCRTDA